MAKREFKKGDIVVLSERYAGAEGRIGSIAKIMSIDDSSVPYQLNDYKKLHNWSGDYTWCKNVRKPTHEELAAVGIYSETTYEIF